MASRRFRRELSAALPEWQTKGWLSDTGAKALRETYRLDENEPSLGPLLRALFGAVFIGGGLILLLAHNWDQFPLPVRVALAFVPLLATLGLGAWVLKRAPDRLPWTEAAGLANSLAVALAISVVAQVYQISGDTPRFLLTWALLTLPAIFLLRSGAAWVLYQILIAWWAWEVVDRGLVTPVYLALLVPSLAIFWLPSWRLGRPATVTGVALPLFFAIDSSLGAALREAHTGAWYWTLYLAWFGLATLLTSEAQSGTSRWIAWLSRLGCGSLLLSLTFDENWRDFRYSVRQDASEWAVARVLVLLALLLLPLAVLLVSRWKRLHPTDRWWAALGIYGLVVGMAREQGFDPLTGAILTNMIAGGLAAETMRRALLERDVPRLNLGWLLLSALVVLRFFDSDWSYLVRGLVFIALGCSFLGLNVWLRRRNSAS